jgi:hypothetical protein
MSKIESIIIKSKGADVGTLEYEAPENLKEGIKMDGEDKVFTLYSAQRKIKARDAERNKLTGGGGLPKAITAALKSADPDTVAQIAAALGVEL